jgi:hypothetical protein
MTVISIDPVVREAIPEKVFNILWLSSLAVITPTPGGENRIVLTHKPMASDWEVLHDQEERVASDELMLAAQEVPEVGIAFGAIMAAIVPLTEWIKERERLRNLPPEQEGGE